jgi:hypothetical protein
MASGASLENRLRPASLARFWRRVSHALPRRRELARARIHRLLHPSARARKQIVICGFPRSGTSLLYNMLAGGLPHFAHDEFEASALQSVWRFEDHLSKLPLDILRLPELARHLLIRHALHDGVAARVGPDLDTEVRQALHFVGRYRGVIRPRAREATFIDVEAFDDAREQRQALVVGERLADREHEAISRHLVGVVAERESSVPPVHSIDSRGSRVRNSALNSRSVHSILPPCTKSVATKRVAGMPSAFNTGAACVSTLR